VFEIEFTDQAIEDLQWFKKYEQNVILDGIESNLAYRGLQKETAKEG